MAIDMDEGMNEAPWCYVMQISPRLRKSDVEKIIEVDMWDIIIILKDGRKFIFETDTGYHRSLFYNNLDELTDEQERREFGYALRTRMKRSFINQDKLAERVRTSQTMISHYMTGRCIPNVLMARKIAKALGCSMDDLFYIDYTEYLEEE